MALVDKLVDQTEREIAEIKRNRTSLENSIADTKARIAKYDMEEKEARKLLKTLRARQKNRPNSVKAPLQTQTTSTPETSTTSPGNSSPDYEGALEVLKEQETFKLSEFAELAGQADSKTARTAIKHYMDKGLINRVQAGIPGVQDSAIYEVTR